MQDRPFVHETPDGWPLRVYHWIPDGEVRGVVQIAHGMAEHAGRYQRFAQAATARGWAVIADDHRGHGASVRSEDDRGHFADEDGWNRMVSDLLDLSDRARREHPDGPLVLLGHSMGSSLVLSRLVRRSDDVAATVLSGPVGKAGPMLDLGLLAVRFERWRLGRTGLSALLDALSFGDFNRRFAPARTKFDWLSRDEAEVDAYVDDPWCGHLVTTQHWFDHLHAIRANGRASVLRAIRSDLPIHVVAGSMDPVGGFTKQVDALRHELAAAGLRSVTHHYVDGARHEVLNETVREAVTTEILDFFDGAVG